MADHAGCEGDRATAPSLPGEEDAATGWRRIRPLAGWRLLTWNMQRVGGPERTSALIEAIDYVVMFTSYLYIDFWIFRILGKNKENGRSRNKVKTTTRPS